MTEAVEEEEQSEIQRWIYGGIRVHDGKRTHAWIDHTARERWYSHKKAGSWAVGSVYLATLTKTDDHIILHGHPEYVGERADDALRRELWAKDQAARAQLELLAQQRRDAADNPIDAALEPLRQMAGKLRAGHQRDAFVAYVMRKLLAG